MKSLHRPAGKIPTLHTTQPQCRINYCISTAIQLPDSAQEVNFQPIVTNPWPYYPLSKSNKSLDYVQICKICQYPESTKSRTSKLGNIICGPRSRNPELRGGSFPHDFEDLSQNTRLERVRSRFPVGK
ncbi:Hypothetical_protein [Hexamita inflata]|uniref:Hypothetical_protein n=1 Tax=Hexamita inflata TaxID=28002 RepID=A0AA86NN36_9EUKA|nr:Hypothetical protein HINF_LOCUS10239 [Hexamita inflata]